MKKKSSNSETVFPTLNFNAKFPLFALSFYTFRNKILFFKIIREISRENYCDWQHCKNFIPHAWDKSMLKMKKWCDISISTNLKRWVWLSTYIFYPTSLSAPANHINMIQIQKKFRQVFLLLEKNFRSWIIHVNNLPPSAKITFYREFLIKNLQLFSFFQF